MPARRFSLIALLTVAIAGLAAAPASADNFVVTRLDDTSTDANCLPGNCTLRQAANASIGTTGPDDITVPAGTIALAGGLGLNNINIPSGIVTIHGAGLGATTIMAPPGYMVFTPSDATLTLRDLAITGGNPTTSGGAIHAVNSSLTLLRTSIHDNTSRPFGAQPGNGGAVQTIGGSLTIRDSQIFSNNANPAANIGGVGGGIATGNTLVEISDSTIAGNRAKGGANALGVGGGASFTGAAQPVNVSGSTISGNVAEASSSNGGVGGGINAPGVTSNFLNSTIANNLADSPPVGLSLGGGISSPGANLTFTSSTIAGNTARGDAGRGGSLSVPSSPVRFVNSIIANGTAAVGSNCAGPPAVSTGGRNIESADTCGLGALDLKNTDPQLGPLGGNGGPTQTMAISAFSAPHNAAIGCPPPGVDQRGVARPQGSACDIGAFELAVPVPPQDTTPPTLAALVVDPSSFVAAGGRGSSIAAKRRSKTTGTRVRFTLSEAAKVVFTIERKVKGRKKGKKCVVKRKRGKRCTTYKTVKGNFSQASSNGPNSFKFTGRLNGKRLKRGSYRLIATPTDAAGLRGTVQRKSFKIKKR